MNGMTPEVRRGLSRRSEDAGETQPASQTVLGELLNFINPRSPSATTETGSLHGLASLFSSTPDSAQSSAAYVRGNMSSEDVRPATDRPTKRVERIVANGLGSHNGRATARDSDQTASVAEDDLPTISESARLMTPDSLARRNVSICPETLGAALSEVSHISGKRIEIEQKDLLETSFR